MIDKNYKENLIQHLKNLLNQQIDNLDQEIKLLQASANEETKSSAGDKYETGRAMAQNEIQKLQFQKGNVQAQRLKLSQINFKGQSISVSIGSLIETIDSIILIGVGFGEIQFDGTKIIVISSVSPVGKILINKYINQNVELFGKQTTIKNIV